MDLYAVTQALGKDPTSRAARTNVNILLRKHGITPQRRNYYDDKAIKKFAAAYHAGLTDGRRQRRKKVQP